MFAIRGNARSRGPRDGSRTRLGESARRPARWTLLQTSRTQRLPTARAHNRRLARSTAVFSLATAVSRVLGLVREMVSAYFFGVSGLINAFTVAIQIPNLVRALVADAALSGAFVPVFSELLEKGERKRAWRVASTLFWLTLLDARRDHRRVHPPRAAPDAPVRRPGRRLRPRRRAVPRPLPDRRPPRPVRDRRRDPQHVQPLRAARTRAGRLEPGDHRRAPPRRPADRRARARSCTSTPASSCSGRSCSSSCRFRGCAASTAGSRWSSTGATRR